MKFKTIKNKQKHKKKLKNKMIGGEENFEGTTYRTADNWNSIIPTDNKPIKYLEIGAFYGANLISVAKTYGKHNESILYAVDPWEDYKDYPEYKETITNVYDSFMKNIKNSGEEDKIKVIRGYSNIEIPKFEDNYFDIIYIDGNHEPEYVLEDAVLAFRKLKSGGYMIFDDYGWGGPELTQKGIDSFVAGYHKKIKVLNININYQSFIQKL
jgi:predicted O-methyltransferase YrrM